MNLTVSKKQVENNGGNNNNNNCFKRVDLISKILNLENKGAELAPSDLN